MYILYSKSNGANWANLGKLCGGVEGGLEDFDGEQEGLFVVVGVVEDGVGEGAVWCPASVPVELSDEGVVGVGDLFLEEGYGVSDGFLECVELFLEFFFGGHVLRGCCGVSAYFGFSMVVLSILPETHQKN